MAVRHGFGRVGRSVAGWGAAPARHQGEISAVPRGNRGAGVARARRERPATTRTDAIAELAKRATSLPDAGGSAGSIRFVTI
jgi:hypothetical protein